MNIIFISNYMNHHQEAFSNELYKLTDGNYYFIACTPMNPARISLGYTDMNKKYDFIIRPYESNEQAKLAEKLVKESNVVIFGSGDEKYLKIRMKENKLLFRYVERLYKGEMTFKRWVRAIIGTYIHFARFSKKFFYVLCASAYTSADVNKFYNFKGRTFKWGYFPEMTLHDDIDELINRKKKNSIIWVARFIELKHPEIPVVIAKKLKKNGYDFEFNLIGSGNLLPQILRMIVENDLEDCVKLLGAMSPDKVREYMEKSEIFLFTSDFNEGWGAVLNEAMNSGCACIASHAIGAAPFLIDNDKNGFIYKNGDIDDLYEKVKFLLDNPEKREDMGKSAYITIKDEWNPRAAAERVIELANAIYEKKDYKALYKSGPCSLAEINKN